MTSRAQKQPARQAAGRENRAALLRLLPSVDECVRAAEQRASMAGFSRAYLKTLVTSAQDGLREAIMRGSGPLPSTRDAMFAEIISKAERAASADAPALRSVINATGVVLHTNLGRALLAEQAIDALVRAARSPVNLEYDLESGERGERDLLVESELCALTGAEAATVVNNNAAAVLLALGSLAQHREVIVSRGELIEIGGSFRLPDVMARSGARLREVGTTNRTHPRDYEAAIGPETALLMKVHPSNYRVIGFTSEVALADLVKIGQEHGIPVIEDLGSGALVDLAAYGLAREPVVAERIAMGAGLVTFSGDKLLGGPQAGVVVGRRELVQKLRQNPLKRALRCDKLTMAALSATLRIYLRSGDITAELPTLRLLTRSRQELAAMAPRAGEILAERLGREFTVEIIESDSQIGSGALPTEAIPTVALRVAHPAMSPHAVAELFRRARPPVVGRIKDGFFQLDLRTIEDPSLLAVSFPSRPQ